MDSFIGEIRILPYTFAPLDWAYCNGALMTVQQNPALYSIIGNTFGGTPNVSFNLPNMQGSAAIGAGQGPNLTPRRISSKSVGAPSITLTPPQLPSHNHTLTAQSTTTPADITATPDNQAWLSHGEASGKSFFTFAPSNPSTYVNIHGVALSANGEGKPHDNMQPYLGMNFCISLAGEYPIRP